MSKINRLCNLPAFFQLGAIGAVLFSATPSHAAAAWQNGVSYGGTTKMDLYVPTAVDASPGIVVALHYCGGNSSNAHGWVQDLADKYGFIIIAPSAGGNCFDASPVRSGERDAISKMVAYVVTKNHADAKRVFAVGASSGACMTQALIAAYPEVFAGGSVLAGVPAGAWTGGNAYGWTTPTKTAAAWGDIVRKASPDFTGARPHVQLWHGTGDTTLTYAQNFPAEVLQWTNVLGVSDANSMTSSFKAQDTWARITYKDATGTVVLETNVAQGVPHDLSGRGLWPDVIRFFGLDMDGPAGSGGGGAGGASGGAGAPAAGGGTASGGAGGGVATTGGTGGSLNGAAGALNGAAGAVNSAAGAANSAAGSPASSGGAPGSVGGGTAGAKPTGSAGSAATSALAASDDGGCSVSVAHGGQRQRGALVGLLLAGLAAVIRRRRPSAI